MIKKIFTRENIIFLIILFFISFLIGFSNYFRLPLNNFKDTLAFMIHGIVLISSVFGIFYLISINRYVFIVLFAPISLLASLASWSLYVPNIPISSAILDVAINTEWKVTKEFLSAELFIYFATFLAAIALIYYVRLRKKTAFSKMKIVHYLLALLIILPAVYVNQKRANTIGRRVPYSIISAFNEYQEIQTNRRLKRETIGDDASLIKNDSLNVILILGESLRNDHLGLNNYKRQTNPLLCKQDIITLPNTKSQYTYTSLSIPQILTRADSLNPERAYSEETFISFFKRCNFETYWFANQNPEAPYNAIAKSSDFYIPTSIGSDEYSDKLWTDQNILSVFDQSIQTTKNQKLIVLHTIGSHWYYNYRYPEAFKKFIPVTKSRSIGHNTREEIINSYDNSVLYMDYFVNSIIEKMKLENCILFYVSDHGELLGEDEQWLHAVEHEALHNAASFIWMSEKYKQLNPQKNEALRLNANNDMTTSFLFHSILDAASIKTNVMDSLQSIFHIPALLSVKQIEIKTAFER